MGLFADLLREEATHVTTENGQAARNTSGDALVDLFSVIGALRNNNAQFDKERYKVLVLNAWNKDPLLTMKILFYARDIREGLGERDLFKLAMVILIDHHYEDSVLKNIHLIPEFGRWDDLYAFEGTILEKQAYSLIKEQFIKDVKILNGEEDGNISLLAKWIKTPDASSPRTKALGIKTAKFITGGKPVKDYKRDLRKLRKHLKLVEIKMSANKWTDIEYDKIPSRAMFVHKNAFENHDSEGFRKYISDVKSGKKTINADTVYPFDIAKKILYSNEKDFSLYEELWKQLPNTVDGSHNFLVMADTSGSMTGDPMAKSIGLAIYFAQRNMGPMHNLYMTFSESPTIEDISKYPDLESAIRGILRIGRWGFNTDLEKAFGFLLEFAMDNNIKQEDMPESLIIISDMEIDEATYCNDEEDPFSFQSKMEAKYKDAGYTLPNIVYWNCASRQNLFHSDANHKGVQLVSGNSVNTFKLLAKSLGMTPHEVMMEAITAPRYSEITV